MNTQKGIALYLVVVMTSVGLAIALGVADIVLLESRITRGLLPSFKAFFVADAGVECAAYWRHFGDDVNDVFQPSSPSTFNITCNDGSVSVSHPPPAGGVEVFDFSFNYPDPTGSPYCVSVRVAKATVPDRTRLCTSIRSSGQNRSCGAALGDNTLERTLIVRDPEDCKFAF